jgi:hypothetical protein
MLETHSHHTYSALLRPFWVSILDSLILFGHTNAHDPRYTAWKQQLQWAEEEAGSDGRGGGAGAQLHGGRAGAPPPPLQEEGGAFFDEDGGLADLGALDGVAGALASPMAAGEEEGGMEVEGDFGPALEQQQPLEERVLNVGGGFQPVSGAGYVLGAIGDAGFGGEEDDDDSFGGGFSLDVVVDDGVFLREAIAL